MIDEIKERIEKLNKIAEIEEVDGEEVSVSVRRLCALDERHFLEKLLLKPLLPTDERRDQ